MAKREAKLIYKRKESPKWYYRFWVEGEEFKGSTGEESERAALLFTLKLKEEKEAIAKDAAAVRATGAREKTLEQLLEDWYASVGSMHGDAKNIRSIINKLLGKLEKRAKNPDGSYVRTADKGFVMVKLPGLNPARKVQELTQAEVTDLYDLRIRSGTAPSTANRELAWLQAAINWGRTRGIRVPEWRDQFKEMKKDEGKGKQRFIDAEDEEKLLAVLDPKGDPRRVDQYHIVIVALDLGTRYSEAASLQWSDVDFDAECVYVWRSKTDNRSSLAMTHRLYNVLADRWNNPDRDPACPYVFPARTGDGHRGYSTKGIRAAMKKAGLNDDHKVKRYGKATFHSTRDTCATKIVRGGLSLADVQAQLGHATPAMSQKYAQASTSIASTRVAKLFNEIEHGRVIKKKAVA